MAYFPSFIDTVFCVLYFFSAPVQLPICLLQAVLHVLSMEGWTVGPALLGMAEVPERSNFGRGG